MGMKNRRYMWYIGFLQQRDNGKLGSHGFKPRALKTYVKEILFRSII